MDYSWSILTYRLFNPFELEYTIPSWLCLFFALLCSLSTWFLIWIFLLWFLLWLLLPLVTMIGWFLYWITSMVILSIVLLPLSFLHCSFPILWFLILCFLPSCSFYNGFFLILWFPSYSTSFVWLMTSISFPWFLVFHFLWLSSFVCDSALSDFSFALIFPSLIFPSLILLTDLWLTDLWLISFVRFFSFEFFESLFLKLLKNSIENF